MDFAPYSAPAKAVADLLNSVLKRVLPEKMSETDAAVMQQQITLELMKADWGGVEKEYADRLSARELAKADVDKGNWFSNILAATIRPFFGFVVMGAFVFSFAQPYIPGAPPLPITDIQKEIILSVIYFYFGGRTVEKGIAMWKGVKK